MLKGNAMSETTVGLGLPRTMNVPGICRGALSHWHQLEAAMADLGSDPATMASMPPGFFDPGQLGGTSALHAALAIDAGLLHRAAAPAAVQAQFVWLTGQVYQTARLVQVSLRNMAALVAAPIPAPRDSRAAGEFIREALVGPTGLQQHAARLSANAAAFAARLQGMVAHFGCDLAGAQAALADAAATPAAAGHDHARSIEHAMGSHARLLASEQGEQAMAASRRLAAARVSALAVLTNMLAAADTLATAAQDLVDQLEETAALPTSDLARPAYLDDHLHLNAASDEWREFADVVQQYLQRILN